jgi:hypothetical protein
MSHEMAWDRTQVVAVRVERFGVIVTCSGYGQWLTFVVKVVDLVILWNREIS